MSDMSAYMQQGAMQANGTMMPEPRILPAISGRPSCTWRPAARSEYPLVTVMATAMPLYGRADPGLSGGKQRVADGFDEGTRTPAGAELVQTTAVILRSARRTSDGRSRPSP